MTNERVERFITARSSALADRQEFELKTLTLDDVVGPNSPLWLHSQPTGSASDLVIKLIDAGLTHSDELFAFTIIEELALLVAKGQAGAGYPRFSEMAAAAIKAYSHQGGQSFWHLLSGESAFYATVKSQLGISAMQRRRSLSPDISHASNRITKSFIEKYCTADFVIDWSKLVESTSRAAA